MRGNMTTAYSFTQPFDFNLLKLNQWWLFCTHNMRKVVVVRANSSAIHFSVYLHMYIIVIVVLCTHYIASKCSLEVHEVAQKKGAAYHVKWVRHLWWIIQHLLSCDYLHCILLNSNKMLLISPRTYHSKLALTDVVLIKYLDGQIIFPPIVSWWKIDYGSFGSLWSSWLLLCG